MYRMSSAIQAYHGSWDQQPTGSPGYFHLGKPRVWLWIETKSGDNPELELEYSHMPCVGSILIFRVLEV